MGFNGAMGAAHATFFSDPRNTEGKPMMVMTTQTKVVA
jgi:hypothetical protein